jgi:hypothetical protein
MKSKHNDVSSISLFRRSNIINLNHTHLGIEDLMLHQSFIHHLFDLIQNYWWSPTDEVVEQQQQNLHNINLCCDENHEDHTKSNPQQHQQHIIKTCYI